MTYMKDSIFWDKTSCGPLKVSRRFGETCRIHSQGQIQKRTACYLLHVGFVLGLFFDSEDGDDILLQNVDLLSTDYITLYPRR
jgi:hypothetical protein